jgi:hypothetical protein
MDDPRYLELGTSKAGYDSGRHKANHACQETDQEPCFALTLVDP